MQYLLSDLKKSDLTAFLQAKRYAQSLPALKPGKPRRELKPLYSISPNKESTLLQEEILQERVRTHMEHRRILEELDKL